MASDPDTVAYICDQAGLGAALTHRRMFGEYALYLHGKVVAFVCDNQLFLKPTPEGRAFLGTPVERPAYPGSKPYYLLTDELDDRDRLRQALRVTEAALPTPAPKRPKAALASRPKTSPAKTAAAKSAKPPAKTAPAKSAKSAKSAKRTQP